MTIKMLIGDLLKKYLKTRVRIEHPYGYMWGELDTSWEQPEKFFVHSDAGYVFFRLNNKIRLYMGASLDFAILLSGLRKLSFINNLHFNLAIAHYLRRKNNENLLEIPIHNKYSLLSGSTQLPSHRHS